MLTLTLPRFVASFIEAKPVRKPRDEQWSIDPDRNRLVEEISALNPGATASFLASFEMEELETYRDHLEHSHRPRGSESRWVRPEGSPGIVMHETRG